MYPYQHDAERRMTELAEKFTQPTAIERRILNQLARELLLAESSDWAFQIYQGTTVEYSSRRFQSHIHRFDLLAKMLEPDVAGLSQEDIELLFEIEHRDNIFAEIDFTVYRRLNSPKQS
jgi:1,4-alpha-glucan branching enzyme